MAYLAVAIVALLIGGLSVAYVYRRPDATTTALDTLQESHARAHEADEAEAKTADPVDYVRTGLERLR